MDNLHIKQTGVNRYELIGSLGTAEHDAHTALKLCDVSNSNEINVFDFTKLKYINSIGVGILVTCINTVREHGGNIIFTNINEDIIGLFTLCNLTEFFTIEENGYVS